MRSHDNFFTTTLIDRQAGTSSRVDNVVKNAICHAHWTGSDPVTTDELGDCTIYGYRNDDNDPADGYITISTSYTDKATTAAPVVIAIKDETGTATANPIHINFEDGRSIDNDGTTSVLISSDHGAMTLYIVGDMAFIEDYYAPSFAAVNEVNVDGVTVTGDGTVSGPLATFSSGTGDEFLADDGTYKPLTGFKRRVFSSTANGDDGNSISSETFEKIQILRDVIYSDSDYIDTSDTTGYSEVKIKKAGTYVFEFGVPLSVTGLTGGASTQKVYLTLAGSEYAGSQAYDNFHFYNGDQNFTFLDRCVEVVVPNDNDVVEVFWGLEADYGFGGTWSLDDANTTLTVYEIV